VQGQAGRLGALARKELLSHSSRLARRPLEQVFAALPAYTHDQFLAELKSHCPVASAFLLAAAEHDAGTSDARNGLSTAAATAALLKAANSRFIWDHGRNTAWTVFNHTQSDKAVGLLGGLGVGAPRDAPQRTLQPAVAAAVTAAPAPPVAAGCDVIVGVDNLQRQTRGQSRISAGTPLSIPVSSANIVFRVPLPAGLDRPAQSVASDGPVYWTAFDTLPENFHTQDVDGRAELLSAWEVERLRMAMDQRRTTQSARRDTSCRPPGAAAACAEDAAQPAASWWPSRPTAFPKRKSAVRRGAGVKPWSPLEHSAPPGVAATAVTRQPPVWPREIRTCIPLNPGVDINAFDLLRSVQDTVGITGGQRHWGIVAVDGGVATAMYKYACCTAPPFRRRLHSTPHATPTSAVAESDTLRGE
jgi:hypothetical protein